MSSWFFLSVLGFNASVSNGLTKFIKYDLLNHATHAVAEVTAEVGLRADKARLDGQVVCAVIDRSVERTRPVVTAIPKDVH